MENVVWFGFGVEVILRDDQYFVRYDAGEIVERLEEVPVTPEQVERVKVSEAEAYKVLIEAKARFRAS
jgi:hypothetical protein